MSRTLFHYTLVLLFSTILTSRGWGENFSSNKNQIPSITRSVSTPVDETSSPVSSMKKRWAVPITKPGAPNLHKVTDDLFRGAQPTAEGFRQLKDMGIKTVINLRSFHSDRGLLRGTGLGYEHMKVKAWHVEKKEVIRFLKIATDKNRTPVFVHCKHGADRTGVMCAIYRIIVCGWTKEEAIAEMTKGGFGHHKIWKNLVFYIQNLDVEALKKKMDQSR